MCAIAGLVNLSSNENILENMLNTMKRRGPDENGIFTEPLCTLLHSRLTVIDPEHGKQPMELSWAGEKYTIIYNGELYNTAELRSALTALGHRFIGHSDTEVMLHAFAQWQELALEKVNGIFAFAIWKHRQHELFLARDRMGVKPLFYSLHGDGLIFASEIKTILTFPSVNAELDTNGIKELLLLGPGRAPGSGVLKGIYELEPGCFGRYKAGKWAWKRYWQLIDRPHEDSFAQTADHVRALVSDAIKRQMVSDFPLGAFLSGGLDSSIICAVCSDEQRVNAESLYTFSLDYLHNDRYFVPEKFQPESDNTYIHTMVSRLETKHNWTTLCVSELFEALQEATIARDLPGMADVDFSLLLFCKQVREVVKVALSGECADEIFGGYPWYRDPDIRNSQGFPWAQNTQYRTAFLAPWIRCAGGIENFVMEHYLDSINHCDILPNTSAEDRRIKEMVNLNQRWFMQTLLDRKDRMSMFSGLEVRVPFCDYRIAEYLYTVPWEFKDYGGREKGLLRYAFRDLLPEDVLYRKKSPYPKTYDPAYLQLVQAALKELLNDRNAPILQIVDPNALKGLLNAEYSWPWYGQLMRLPQTIAYMLQLNFWLKYYKVRVV